jgi:hypothetical protein
LSAPPRRDRRWIAPTGALSLLGDAPASDPDTTVEASLALALERASAVGRWDVVAQLAGPDTAQRPATPCILALGNWWETPLAGGASDPLDW